MTTRAKQELMFDYAAKDAGFSLTYVDRLHLVYRDGSRSMSIGVEFMTTESIIVFADSIETWDSPHQSELVDRQLIVSRVKAALERNGLEVSLED